MTFLKAKSEISMSLVKMIYRGHFQHKYSVS